MTDRIARPLEGLRVIDAASFIAGPFCATLLGEFGAEVIKVELPGVGDSTRRFGTPTEQAETLVWLSEARNKKSVTLDLRKPEGAELFKQLVAKSDVLVENFMTGTLEKWGIGWDVLKQVNPKLVMVRITGYGQTGPKANEPGFARIAQAFSGLSFLAGYPDRPPVTPGSSTIADYNSGLFDAFGADRIAWGSNYPASPGTLAELLADSLAALSFLSADDLERVMGGTAARLYPVLTIP